MNENKTRLIHKIYSTVLSAMLIALGVAFIVSAICVFSPDNLSRLEGEGALTGEGLRAEIGRALWRLLIPSAVTLLLIIASPFISYAFPLPEKKLKPAHDAERSLAITARRTDGALYSEGVHAAILKERKLRLTLNALGILLLILSLIYPIIRIFSSETFTSLGNANEEVMTVSLVLLLFLLPSVIYAVCITVPLRRSHERETALLKNSAEDGIPLPSPSAARIWLKVHAALIGRIAGITILALSFVFIILGVINGGMADVLEKAAKICRECIGLG